MTLINMIKVEKLPEFEKDVKALIKKYKTLEEDILVIEKVIKVVPNASPPFSFRINGLGIKSCIIKVRKIASRSFKGSGVNTGFRLIYAYFEEEGKVVFIELYHKNQKENEDRDRILKNFQ